MTFQKKPKQKSNYPGMLENFEKQRVNNWPKAKQKMQSGFNVRSGFIPGSRKVPTG